MSKLKVGDTFTSPTCCVGSHWEVVTNRGNGSLTIKKINNEGADYSKGVCINWGEDGNEIIINKNMNIKEKFITALLPEPEKSFRKVGITNGDGLLTDDGKAIFLTWLLNQNKTTFNTDVVQALVAEQAKEDNE